jgi:hypothetical protein
LKGSAEAAKSLKELGSTSDTRLRARRELRPRGIERQIDFDDSRQHIKADGDPDLRLHRVLGRAIEMFYA